MANQEYTDAFIFLAVARSDGGTLAQFIAAADHINCGVPGDMEIECSINRLRSCELVEISGHCFSLTRKGKDLFEAIGGIPAYPRKQIDPAIPLLKKAIGFTPVEIRWHVDPKETAAAYREYSKLLRNRS